MESVPVTFEELEAYIIRQEKIIVKSIKNDEPLQKLIEKNKIKLTDEELDNILTKLNIQIKKKYRIRLFLRQSRFQVIQQIIQVERDHKKDQINNINNINSIILSIFDQNVGDIEDMNGNNGSLIFDENILGLLKELPDSNLLETNDIELIEGYDKIRDKLILNVKKIKENVKSIDKLNRITDNIKNIETVSKDDGEDDDLQEKINKEIERMRYLLAFVKSKQKAN